MDLHEDEIGWNQVLGSVDQTLRDGEGLLYRGVDGLFTEAIPASAILPGSQPGKICVVRFSESV